MRPEGLPATADRVVAMVPAHWRRPLAAVACAWLALIGLFHGDWLAMAHQWWDSSTYNHILVVPVILGWLVAQRLPGLWQLRPTPWWPGLALLGAAMMLWVLGAFAGFAQITQACAVAMLVASVLALLGPKVGWGLAFPLFYMGFLVPFGDEAVPLLQTITARLTIGLVHLTQVPATIDGVFIATPAGLFEVAEACSGVKFLVAMVAFGALAANVCFVSWRKRAGFMALCVAAPVLANGVRAWGTVYVAQFYGAKVAGGIDHIIYGWIFFALVIAGVIAAGWPFFDRAVGAPMIAPDAIDASPLLTRAQALRVAPGRALAGGAVMAALALGWVALADRIEAPMPRHVALPQVAGWHRVDYAPHVWWQPRAGGADHRLLGRYADGRGHAVDVFYALYAAQGPGRKAGGFGEGALTPGSGWAWQSPGPAAPDAKSDRLLAGGPTERLAQTTYRTGDLLTGSNLALKLANIGDRLLLRRRSTMMLILSAEEAPGHPAAASVEAFRAGVGPLGAWMDAIAKGA